MSLLLLRCLKRRWKIVNELSEKALREDNVRAFLDAQRRLAVVENMMRERSRWRDNRLMTRTQMLSHLIDLVDTKLNEIESVVEDHVLECIHSTRDSHCQSNFGRTNLCSRIEEFWSGRRRWEKRRERFIELHEKAEVEI